MTKNDPAAQLFYDSNLRDGVTVITYDWVNGNAGTGEIVQNKMGYHFPNTYETDMLIDKAYPVDVKAGTDFYGGNDFVGIDGASLSAFFAWGNADYTSTLGYIEGFGFNEFKETTGEGYFSFGIGVSGDFQMSNIGTYVGYDFPSPLNFIGDGRSGGLDLDVIISYGYSKWSGNGNGPGGIAWRGTTHTVGLGFSGKLASGGPTKTSLLFPKGTNYNINYSEWKDRRLNNRPTIKGVRTGNK